MVLELQAMSPLDNGGAGGYPGGMAAGGVVQHLDLRCSSMSLGRRGLRAWQARVEPEG